MGLRFVHDPSVERFLGGELYGEIQEATQGVGDCVSCSKKLGNGGPVRMETSIVPGSGFGMAYVRHASCAPVAGGAEGMVYFPDSTYQIVSGVIPLTSGDDSYPVPIVVVNPSCDVFLLNSDAAGREFYPLLDAYRKLGYRDVGSVVLFGSDDEPGIVGWRIESDGIHLDLGLMNVVLENSAFSSEKFISAASKVGGFIVAVSFKHHASDLYRDRTEMMRLMTSGGAVLAWVPVVA